MPDYNLLGSTEVLEELQEGRTRELLLLLQNKPVPEVVDPLNIQGGLSSDYRTDGDGDYQIRSDITSTATRPNDTATDTGLFNKTGVVIEPNEDLDQLQATISSNTSGFDTAYILLEEDQSTIAQKDISSLTAGDTVTFTESLSNGTKYDVVLDGSGYEAGIYDSSSFPYTSSNVDIVDGIAQDGEGADANSFVSVRGVITFKQATVTDHFSAPTTAPVDFKAWEAIRARDVTEGGSTSIDPVEFEILDSSDTVLNSTRIPKARIGDEPFKMRNRVYSKDAGSDEQSDYQIATTGDGGHFGIPILTVVSVKKNGSVLDSDNWSFDGDTTVTIDTSNVSIASGDTIDIKYDFDVFDSTLQPRAYLSRESGSETSPSISHFRYEYVV